MNIYLVFSAFTSKQTSLLASTWSLRRNL